VTSRVLFSSWISTLLSIDGHSNFPLILVASRHLLESWDPSRGSLQLGIFSDSRVDDKPRGVVEQDQLPGAKSSSEVMMGTGPTPETQRLRPGRGRVVSTARDKGAGFQGGKPGFWGLSRGSEVPSRIRGSLMDARVSPRFQVLLQIPAGSKVPSQIQGFLMDPRVPHGSKGLSQIPGSSPDPSRIQGFLADPGFPPRSKDPSRIPGSLTDPRVSPRFQVLPKIPPGSKDPSQIQGSHTDPRILPGSQVSSQIPDSFPDLRIPP